MTSPSLSQRRLFASDGVTLAGAIVNRAALPTPMALMSVGRADQRKALVSHRLPLSRLQEGFEALLGRYHLDGRDAIKIAVDPWQS